VTDHCNPPLGRQPATNRIGVNVINQDTQPRRLGGAVERSLSEQNGESRSLKVFVVRERFGKTKTPHDDEGNMIDNPRPDEIHQGWQAR
jgi:hypothetical protein